MFIKPEINFHVYHNDNVLYCNLNYEELEKKIAKKKIRPDLHEILVVTSLPTDEEHSC